MNSARWQRKQEQKRLERNVEIQSRLRKDRKVESPMVPPKYPYEISFTLSDSIRDMERMMRGRRERFEVELDPYSGDLIELRSGRRFISSDSSPRSSDPELRRELEAAKAKLVEQNTLLQRLAAGASPLADVIQVEGATTFVSVGGNLISVVTPDPACEPGDQVKLVGETMQIREKLERPCALGEIATVDSVHGDGYCEIKHGGSTRLVVGRSGLEAGDRVVMDRTGKVVTRKLASTAAPPPDTGVTWDSIGGLEDAKRALRDAIELPYTHRDLYARYGQKATKGVLLYGPPGNGKSLLGKAVATALAAQHGPKPGGFIYVKGPEILDKFVGASEENVRSLFEKARAYKAKHGHPAVIFIDEAESVLGARGSGSFMGNTIVPQFLAEMDGMADSGAFVLLATNRPDSLDPAAVRDGRIDRRIRVGRPSAETASDIFKIHLRNRPTAINSEELADAASKCLFAAELVLFSVELRSGASAPFTLAHVVNGAMIAGIVQRAVQRAIHREIAGETTSGIAVDDVVESVAQTYREQKDIDQRANVEEFLESIGEPAQRITKGHAHARAS